MPILNVQRQSVPSREKLQFSAGKSHQSGDTSVSGSKHTNGLQCGVLSNMYACNSQERAVRS